MTLVKEEKKIQVPKEEEKDLVETKEKNLLKDHQELTENLLKVDLKTMKLLEKAFSNNFIVFKSTFKRFSVNS